jgi:predicted nucleic acid-binding protein
MKKEDRFKPAADRVLEGINSGRMQGVYASSAALQEVIFWFYNRRLMAELVDAVNFLVHIENLEWVGLTPEICLNAALLMGEYDVGPFDAYHAATAILRDKTILSTEHIYDKIKGIERIDPIEIMEKP